MNGDEVECAEALCCLSEAGQTDGNPSFFQSSWPGRQILGSSERKVKSSRSRVKSGGGFTCCVPGCSNNHKRNPELSFYNFPNGKSQESKELRKKWINLIPRKDFSPTMGHRVCSEHFPGGKKTYMNRLPTIIPTTVKRISTKPRRTTKERNRTVDNSYEFLVQRGKCSLSSDVEQDTSDVQNIGPEETSRGTHEITHLSILREQVVELTKENKRLKSENERQRTQISELKEQLQNEQRRNSSVD